jgi:hypothetical protein
MWKVEVGGLATNRFCIEPNRPAFQAMMTSVMSAHVILFVLPKEEITLKVFVVIGIWK